MARLAHSHQDFLPIINSRDAGLPFEVHVKKTVSFPLRGQQGSDRRLDDFPRLNASDLRIGQPGEQGTGTDLLENGRVLDHKRSKYSCTSFTAMAPSPTPEVTPLAERWRT